MPGLAIRRVISFKLRVWAGPTTRVTWSQAPITRPPYLTILARDGHFGGEHGLLGIFDMASLKGINIPFRERIQHHVITKTLLSWAENRKPTITGDGDNEKDWRQRDSGFKGGHRGHLRGECYFSGRSPDTSGSGQAGTGTTPSDGAQVITRWEAQNVIRMCETIILELFTLGLTLSHPGPALCPPSAGRSSRCFLTAGHFLLRNTITSLSRHKLLVIFPSTEILFVHHQHPRKYHDRNVCM